MAKCLKIKAVFNTHAVVTINFEYTRTIVQLELLTAVKSSHFHAAVNSRTELNPGDEALE